MAQDALYSCTDMATVGVKGSTTLHKLQPSQLNKHDGCGFVSHRASHTTRSRYADEVAGRDYQFISLDEFDRGIKLVCIVLLSGLAAKFLSADNSPKNIRLAKM